MKRIGFVLASIHTGSALSLWPPLAGDAERAGYSFYIFPGGKLDSRPDSEYLRNSVYRLVNAANLDGLISWGSTIGGAVPVVELESFHKNLAGLPYVTIAHKMAGHPCVRFDAYTGMKSLVLHFIRVHGARRIAFLRGPETHTSSGDRFRGYCDAFSEAGIEFDPFTSPLVSDPFPWSDGTAAAEQLYCARNLVPGQDFDVLIGSSDMMAFSAVRYLEKYGYNVPRDFRVGGFNDSEESRVLSTQFSTVHMPYAELGHESFRMIRTLLYGKGAIDDRLLAAEVVIRESCGCHSSPSVTDSVSVPNSVSVPGGRSKNADWLIHEVAVLLGMDATGENAVVEPVIGAFFAGNDELFFNLLERALTRFFESDSDVSRLLDAVGFVRNSELFQSVPVPDFANRVFRSIVQVQGRVSALKKYETSLRHIVLNKLKCELLCTRDRNTLIGLLSRYLPETGIFTAAVVLYEKDDFSRCIGFFSSSGTVTGDECGLFPSSQLLPASQRELFSRGIFMVQPLFMENQPLGYFIHSVTIDDGLMYEELRSAVSSALKGIFLFEETARAKQVAEQAERSKTEFFANVGTDLSDPLSEVLEKMEQLEKDISTLVRTPDVLADRIALIKDSIASQLDKTNRLVDLTLSHVDELVLSRRLFRISDIVPGAGSHPALSGDPDRLAQSIALISAECGEEIEVSSTPLGLKLVFRSSGHLPDMVWANHDLLLAEKIILLHYGEFTRELNGCTVLLPWLTLSGLPPKKTSGIPSTIVFIPGAGKLPLESFGLECIDYRTAERKLREGTLSADTVLLAWNPDETGIEDWLSVYALRHHPGLFRAPFLCFGSGISGEMLISYIEQRVRKQTTGPVLFVAARFDRFDRFEAWAPEANTLSISSLDDFNATVAEVTPSLIVFDHADNSSIIYVRQNPRTVLVPILVIPERVESEEDIQMLCLHPRVILCNRGVAASDEFGLRVREILSGDDILPPHTGALVKKAILYMNTHASTQIARWKLAELVSVSEDYLTRIFHKEIGLSLWEYLNRYRIFLATELLLHTNDTIYEVALKTGFQDQAYFCRVFKKVHGISPGKIRSKRSE